MFKAKLSVLLRTAQYADVNGLGVTNFDAEGDCVKVAFGEDRDFPDEHAITVKDIEYEVNTDGLAVIKDKHVKTGDAGPHVFGFYMQRPMVEGDLK